VKTRADAASGSWWSRIGVKSKEEEEEEQPSFAKNINEEKKRKQ
jgi:hypothetical protein